MRKLCFAGMAKKIKDWFGLVKFGKGVKGRKGEWSRCDVNMFEGGGGSCCIQSI